MRTFAASKMPRTLRASLRKTLAAVSSVSLRNPRISTPSYPYSRAREAIVSKSQVGQLTVLKANLSEGIRGIASCATAARLGEAGGAVKEVRAGGERSGRTSRIKMRIKIRNGIKSKRRRKSRTGAQSQSY